MAIDGGVTTGTLRPITLLILGSLIPVFLAANVIAVGALVQRTKSPGMKNFLPV